MTEQASKTCECGATETLRPVCVGAGLGADGKTWESVYETWCAACIEQADEEAGVKTEAPKLFTFSQADNERTVREYPRDIVRQERHVAWEAAGLMSMRITLAKAKKALGEPIDEEEVARWKELEKELRDQYWAKDAEFKATRPKRR